MAASKWRYDAKGLSREAAVRANVVRLSEVVGGGYNRFWRSRHRYRVVKGSRASKKSKTTALWFIKSIMEHPDSNALCVRKTYRTIKDSQWADLKWAASRLKVSHLWDFTKSPLEAVYRPTGQKILFRGLDDPLKVTSITVDVGYLCWLWIEEAYEITDEGDFDTLDESIRGWVPPHLWKQTTLTFNPWNERHWIKARFFDREDPDVFTQTTNYLCNEWLDAADIRMFDRMKANNPRRYNVAGLGNWGIVDGLVFENWVEADGKGDHPEPFAVEHVLEKYPRAQVVHGLDFGYTNDPSALFCGIYDADSAQLWVFDEMYAKGMSNKAIASWIKAAGYIKGRIIADSAEPKSIDELKGYGIRAKPAQKGRDSVSHGVQFIQDLRVIIHPRCVNFITEIGNYTFEKDRFGKTLNRPIDDFNHLMDAMRYAMERFINKKEWKY